MQRQIGARVVKILHLGLGRLHFIAPRPRDSGIVSGAVDCGIDGSEGVTQRLAIIQVGLFGFQRNVSNCLERVRISIHSNDFVPGTKRGEGRMMPKHSSGSHDGDAH